MRDRSVIRQLLARTALAVFLIGLLSSRVLAQRTFPTSQQIEQAKAARAILDAFDPEKTVPSTRQLHAVYFTPTDMAPGKDLQPRLQRILDHVSAFYSRELELYGLGRQSLPLEYDANKNLVVHLVQGQQPRTRYGNDGWGRIREEVGVALAAKGMPTDRSTLLIFCNLYSLDLDRIVGVSPYHGQGNARHGTAWVVDFDLIDPVHLSKKEPSYLNQAGQRRSLGWYNSIFIGGTAHELGHSLGLPHNLENAADGPRGLSLMGAGNYTYAEETRGEGNGSFLAPADALRLASHPMFSGTAKSLDADVNAAFWNLKFDADDKSFRVTGQIDGSLPCYAVLAYLDPEGNSDYDAHTAVVIPSSEGQFAIRCADLVAGKNAEIRLVACFVNGATHQQALPYRVDANGRPDLAKTEQHLKPHDFSGRWVVNANGWASVLELQQTGNTIKGSTKGINHDHVHTVTGTVNNHAIAFKTGDGQAFHGYLLSNDPTGKTSKLAIAGTFKTGQATDAWYAVRGQLGIANAERRFKPHDFGGRWILNANGWTSTLELQQSGNKVKGSIKGINHDHSNTVTGTVNGHEITLIIGNGQEFRGYLLRDDPTGATSNRAIAGTFKTDQATDGWYAVR